MGILISVWYRYPQKHPLQLVAASGRCRISIHFHEQAQICECTRVRIPTKVRTLMAILAMPPDSVGIQASSNFTCRPSAASAASMRGSFVG